MKKHYTLLCMLFCTMILSAQEQDSTTIVNIYDDFQTTVINKDVDGHTSLFTSGEAPVYIIKKEPTGPLTNSLMNVNYWADFFSQSFPYELEISEIELTIDDAFAISEAHFDEYINNEYSASGKDLFGYIRTESGWKLAFLHNTVVLADDLTDYSIPFELPNTIEEVITDFTSYYNNQEGDLLLDLFVEDDNQILVFDEYLADDYDPADFEVLEFSIDLAASVDDKVLIVSNLETHIVDDYVASVFCDYQILLEDEQIESGRAYFNLIASLEDGWQLSSFIRNTSGLVSSIKENSRANLSVYPNPASTTVTIESENEIVGLELIDVLGRKINDFKVNNVNIYLLDVSNYNKGHYFLNLRLADGNKMLQQLIIE